MNKKLKVTIKVIDNVACKIFRKYLIIKYPDTDYLDTKIYNEENLKENI